MPARSLRLSCRETNGPFLDLHQANDGHVLIVPSLHVARFWDLDDATAAQLIAAVRRAAAAVQETFHPVGISIRQSNGAAGQEIDHVHFHVQTRHGEDGLLSVYQRAPEPTSLAYREALASRLRETLTRRAEGRAAAWSHLASGPTLRLGPVRLEPLSHDHAEDLFRYGRDAAIWSYMPRGAFRDLADVHCWIDESLGSAYPAGQELPFAIIAGGDRPECVGSTRYLDLSAENRRLEIGWTWIAAAHQRTAVNSICKYMLLRYAFEVLGCRRVQIKTDTRNATSRAAIERIGATLEGVLRRHVVPWYSEFRDTAMYSVIDEEWPRVKRRLEELLDRG